MGDHGDGSCSVNNYGNSRNLKRQSVPLLFSDDSSLPEDLLIEILSLLPVKSLLRFKCVCKSWLTMFKTPAFVSQHLTKVTDDQRKILAVLTVKRMRKPYYDRGLPAQINARVDFKPCRRAYKILSYNTLDVMPRALFNGFSVSWELLGVYNGVACFHDGRHYNFEIWNLAVGSRHTVKGKSCSSRLRYAFGYDFNTGVHKVIRISSPHGFSYDGEVYNVSTGSWSKGRALIPDGLFFDLYYCDGYGYELCSPVTVCVNGMFSTGVHSGHGEASRNFLLTFDMGNEVSMITPILEGANFAKRGKSYLSALENSVALINKREVGLTAYDFEIYVLNEYGPNGTWIKMYTIGSFHEVTLPVGFRNGDTLLLRRNEKFELLLWDLKANELKKTVHRGIVDRLIEYKESLISIVSFNEGN